MADYSAYFNRLRAQGDSYQDAMIGTTKRLAEQNIMNSPSRVSIDVMRLEEFNHKTFDIVHDETHVAIVSNKDSFYKREVLVPPGVDLQLGMYLAYENMHYLIVESNIDEIYPNSHILLCNNTLELVGEVERKKEAEPDEFGRPIWTETSHKYGIPCAIVSKEYSIAENASIPLPDGVINISIPYHKDINVPVNYMATFNGESYQVTSANDEKVIRPIDGEAYGYRVLRGQRVVDK